LHHINSLIRTRPVSESESERQRARNWTSESERDFSRERATIHTSEPKRAKFKTAHDFSRATVCNSSRVLAVVEASVLLCVFVTFPVCSSHSATLSKRCKLESPHLHCQLHKFDYSFRISKTVRDGPRLLLNDYRKSHKSFRSTPKSATLNNLETQNKGFISEFWVLSCREHLRSELRRNGWK